MTIKLPIQNLPKTPAFDLAWVDSLPPEALHVLGSVLAYAVPKLSEEHTDFVKHWRDHQFCPLSDVMVSEYVAFYAVDLLCRTHERAAKANIPTPSVSEWAAECRRVFEAQEPA